SCPLSIQRHDTSSCQDHATDRTWETPGRAGARCRFVTDRTRNVQVPDEATACSSVRPSGPATRRPLDTVVAVTAAHDSGDDRDDTFPSATAERADPAAAAEATRPAETPTRDGSAEPSETEDAAGRTGKPKSTAAKTRA